MKIDFLTRATGSTTIAIGLIWVVFFAESWLPLVAIIPGILFYLIGVVGYFVKIRETRGYLLVLISLSGVTILTGVIGLVQVGLSPSNVIGLAVVTGLLGWFCRTPLSVLRFQESSSKTNPHEGGATS